MRRGLAAEGRRRPPRPARLCNPARTCAPSACRSRSPPPASQRLALFCLPILRHLLWLSSPPPSREELQVRVCSVRACVCARCGERAPPPPAGQASADRCPRRARRSGHAALPIRLPSPAPSRPARPGLLVERSGDLTVAPETADPRTARPPASGCLLPSPSGLPEAVSRGPGHPSRSLGSQPARSSTRSEGQRSVTAGAAGPRAAGPVVAPGAEYSGTAAFLPQVPGDAQCSGSLEDTRSSSVLSFASWMPNFRVCSSY
ncbi:unnamed protein product [Rangifer tarandus platyrhynchus]|uniref:Uncharacterized protein n=1 Tax=Rangifer tarandus platyrhynchus TaxID=3082113 RepID=A0ABN8Z182_RANTA|nr:unnamed protein product [Rangifer tarandus platyrhynchus]